MEGILSGSLRAFYLFLLVCFRRDWYVTLAVLEMKCMLAWKPECFTCLCILRSGTQTGSHHTHLVSPFLKLVVLTQFCWYILNSVALFACLSVYVTKHFFCNATSYLVGTEMRVMILLLCFLLKWVGDCIWNCVIWK